MLFTYCICLSLQFTEECRTDVYPPPASETKVPTFVLNLDLPPEDRWTPLVKDKAADVCMLEHIRRQYGIMSKAAISLTFDLQCKAIAALFFIPYLLPI